MATRRAATNDTAFNHNLDDILNEEYSSEESDDEAPETKNQYFEFSNSHYVMRFVKLVFYVQTVALLVDHPALEWPVFFETFCRGILFYSLRFYSRPVLDVLYVIQTFWKAIVDAVAAQNLSDAALLWLENVVGLAFNFEATAGPISSYILTPREYARIPRAGFGLATADAPE